MISVTRVATPPGAVNVVPDYVDISGTIRSLSKTAFRRTIVATPSPDLRLMSMLGGLLGGFNLEIRAQNSA